MIISPESDPSVSFPRSIKVFLAGSIDDGRARTWQSEVKTILQALHGDSKDNLKFQLFSPRRQDWDANATSWAKREQILWELDNLSSSNAILMHFEPESLSPITLMELGLYAGKKPIFVSCPKGFWRYENVHVVCAKFDIPLFETLEDACEGLYLHVRLK